MPKRKAPQKKKPPQNWSPKADAEEFFSLPIRKQIRFIADDLIEFIKKSW